MQDNTKALLKTTAAIIGGIAAIAGLSSLVPEEDPKVRKARLKREAAENKRRAKAAAAREKTRQKQAKEFRERQRAQGPEDKLVDIMDILTTGRRSNISVVREIISCENDNDRYNLYRAYMRDGYEFSNVEKERIKQSCNNGSNRWHFM